MTKDGVLRCDMRENCLAPITRLDSRGYIYCEAHGLERQQSQPCRKLRPWERRRLEQGRSLSRY